MTKISIVIMISFLLLIINRILVHQDNVNLDWNSQINDLNLVPYGAKVISPEVFDDHTVIFRVQVPDIKKVTFFNI